MLLRGATAPGNILSPTVESAGGKGIILTLLTVFVCVVVLITLVVLCSCNFAIVYAFEWIVAGLPIIVSYKWR